METSIKEHIEFHVRHMACCPSVINHCSASVYSAAYTTYTQMEAMNKAIRDLINLAVALAIVEINLYENTAG